MNRSDVEPLIGAIDCGTSSARFMVYSANSGELIASHQIPTKPIYPKPEWIEQDCFHILEIVNNAIEKTIEQLKLMNIDPSSIKGIGITNQRESTIAWDKETGQPFHNAIIWSDGRTRQIVDDFLDQIPNRDLNYYKELTGLPISTYFTAFKVKWLLENVPSVKKALEKKRLLIGTVDTWLLWNLCGVYATDVTNASRTFLMNIKTLEWDRHLCEKLFAIPVNILPKIQSSASHFGLIKSGPLQGIPVTGVIGDQHSALVGHHCLSPGQIKSTYGTGCFILQNLGSLSVRKILTEVSPEARKSLILTVAYKLDGKPAVYALEGSIAVVGASMVWLRDNIGIINDFNEIESLANQVKDSGGVYFVPAFQGLFAPYWDLNASGLFIGLSQFTRKSHLVRAMLESVAFQTTDILSLMKPSRSGLKVDGGMAANDSLCQIISDLNNVKVVRPSKIEATALGCAMISGHTLGLWDFEKDHLNLRSKLDKLLEDGPVTSNQNGQQINDEPTKFRDRNYSLSRSSIDDSKLYPNSSIFKPKIDLEVRQQMLDTWHRAVKRSMGWTQNKKAEMKRFNYLKKSGLPVSFFIISSMAMLFLGRYVTRST